MDSEKIAQHNWMPPLSHALGSSGALGRLSFRIVKIRRSNDENWQETTRYQPK
jgi:hypothetical protein